MKAIHTTRPTTDGDADASGTGIIAYEQRLDLSPRWALTEGSLFFEGKGAVQTTLRKITRRLDELGIPYAVSGGLALFAHGFRRFTEDVDVLVTDEGLRQIHKELDGLGFLPPFTGSKNLRDTESGVRIDFLVTGQFPGDGKPKPVAFPEPTSVAVDIDGIKYLSLPTLIELKLASGMTNPERLKDLADVLELVKLLDLPREFSDPLAPFVRDKYLEIWQSTRQGPKRYILMLRNELPTRDGANPEETAEQLRRAQETLAAMRADGVVLDSRRGRSGDHSYYVTADPAIARKYGMHDEAEFLGDEEIGE